MYPDKPAWEIGPIARRKIVDDTVLNNVRLARYFVQDHLMDMLS